MKIKVISLILISSLLIQIVLTSGGCMTFLPVEDNNLAHHQEDDNTLLVKLKDKRDIEVEPKHLIYYGNDSLFIYGKGWELNAANGMWRIFNGFISPAKIDSEEVIMKDSEENHLFWMNDNKRIEVKEVDLARFNSNTMDNYWVAKSENMGYQQFYEKDIAAIEEKGYTNGQNALRVAAYALGLAVVIIGIIKLESAMKWPSER